MKAVYFTEHGGTDRLIFGDRPAPAPEKSQVLLRVKACALNHLDIWVRQGIPGLKIPLPHIGGSDVAGIIEKLGPGVKGFKAGQRVMAAPGLSCGKCPACRKSQDHLCPDYDILGQNSDGGYAERVSVPARNLFPIPANMTFEEAASIPLVFITAWHMLMDNAKLKRGETVLVQGGGSGVGIAAIQIAKLTGARVIATVGTEEKARRAKALGADECVNYREKDFVHEARNLTEKRGVDVVVEHIGQDTFEKSLLCLAKAGRLTTCGATSGREIKFDLRLLFSRNITIYGSRMGPNQGLQKCLDFFKRGKLKPVVDKVFPLKEAPQAHQYMEDRKNFGKIVLTV